MKYTVLMNKKMVYKLTELNDKVFIKKLRNSIAKLEHGELQKISSVSLLSAGSKGSVYVLKINQYRVFLAVANGNNGDEDYIYMLDMINKNNLTDSDYSKAIKNSFDDLNSNEQ